MQLPRAPDELSLDWLRLSLLFTPSIRPRSAPVAPALARPSLRAHSTRPPRAVDRALYKLLSLSRHLAPPLRFSSTRFLGSVS
eukprot:1092892-Rhodomonas_salina.2